MAPGNHHWISLSLINQLITGTLIPSISLQLQTLPPQLETPVYTSVPTLMLPGILVKVIQSYSIYTPLRLRRSTKHCLFHTQSQAISFQLLWLLCQLYFVFLAQPLTYLIFACSLIQLCLILWSLPVGLFSANKLPWTFTQVSRCSVVVHYKSLKKNESHSKSYDMAKTITPAKSLWTNKNVCASFIFQQVNQWHNFRR